MSAVEFMKELKGWRGSACLVRKDGKHYVVSSVDAPFTGPETLVFAADYKGEPLNYMDIAGGRGVTREEAIAELAELSNEDQS